MKLVYDRNDRNDLQLDSFHQSSWWARSGRNLSVPSESITDSIARRRSPVQKLDETNVSWQYGRAPPLPTEIDEEYDTSVGKTKLEKTPNIPEGGGKDLSYHDITSGDIERGDVMQQLRGQGYSFHHSTAAVGNKGFRLNAIARAVGDFSNGGTLEDLGKDVRKRRSCTL